MMPQTDNESTQPGFFPRLGVFLKRLLLAFLKLALLFIVIFALAGVAWLIYQELDRSFDSVTARMDRNTERIELAESDVDILLAESDVHQERVKALETVVAVQEAHIANQEVTIAGLESDLGAGQEQQDEVLTILEAHITNLIASTETISSNVTFLSEGLVSLQGDTTSNVSDIDAVGGEVDALEIDLLALNGQVVEVQVELSDYSAEEFIHMRQALALFRVWEMVSRAQLRLIEQNVGLAADDIDTALASVDRLQAAVPEEEESTSAGLEQVQQRLTLAAANLPDDPLSAARDLETAWELLDAALAELFGELSPTPKETTTAEPTPSP
jgi:chromosome segregation ATPase